MRRDVGRRPGVHVGRWAELKGDATVPDEGGQSAQVGLVVCVGRDVIHDSHAVAQTFGTAVLHGLPDRRRAERLAGVDGEVEVLPLQVLEGRQVQRWGVAGFAAGNIEAHHAAFPVPDRQLSYLE